MPSTQTLAPLVNGGDIRKMATRDAYGATLLELGAERPDVVVLDADLSGSTKTKAFSKAYPERFFNQGVAEANMMGTAAGIATMGYTVFASSFAMFAAGKPWEQIRQSICVPELSVKICATHAGLTVGEDGKSHQMLEDIALMRVLPHMRVIVPADGVEAAQAVRAVAAAPGPFYVRLSRASTPVIFSEDYRFEIGKGSILREGSDVCLAACGVCVAPTLEAAELLAEQGIQARVVNFATIDPIDSTLVAESARQCGAIVTVEEHQIRGGLGDAVAQAVVRHHPVPMDLIGMDDAFGQSGTADELLVYYGISAPAIAQRAQALILRKA
ncbi:MAG: transketolase family protein [Planctomycetes bacterium]|nr:transketolase family protein [Planctomycetota bacterium]MCB9909644.1 transketolase family protein [Planctomycetota bacterium]MCB9911867.1 transketolase family protein [Planctomycetota bacterium]HPF12686.1 transketolase C-terminal domain-containing protein [Planctomycetota bacterium]HRV81514.1 transketolase C-terminal domain-containing protein [Planctomycetota bacterium]